MHASLQHPGLDDLIFHRRTVQPTRSPDVVDRNRALIDQAEGYIYKTIGAHELGAYVFRPAGPAPAGGWPVMLYFYSSMWDGGLVSQFAPHALYLASRGMMGILVDYRAGARHSAVPRDAMEDARSALRWARSHAADLGIDPSKIGACGGGAGGHAALSAAMPSIQADALGDELAVSCHPDFLVLFSPVIDTSKRSGAGFDSFPDKASAREANLQKHVYKGMPPTLLIHSSGDRVVPVGSSRGYRLRCLFRRNVCKLIIYEGLPHGFYNFNVSMQNYEITLTEVDHFLTSHGLISSDPDDDGVPRLS